MYAYVMTGGTQVSIIAEMLAATINQNVGKWHLSPSISEIEKRVISWASTFIGYDPEAGGSIGLVEDLQQISLGLQLPEMSFFENFKVREKGLFGMQPFVVYASSEVHNCVDKKRRDIRHRYGSL